jgi:phage-related protein
MSTISSSYKVKVGGGLQLPYTYRRKVVSFGDGYKQRNTEGINFEQRKLSITFTNLSTADKDALLNITRNSRGVTAIDWECPGDGVTQKWLFTNPQVTYHNGSFWEIAYEVEFLNEN